MKMVIFLAIAGFWIFLSVQGCADGGMTAGNYPCASIGPENEPVQPAQERNAAMSDNDKRIADGGNTQPLATAVVKLETATFALG
jgi:hypothetical protein